MLFVLRATAFACVDVLGSAPAGVIHLSHLCHALCLRSTVPVKACAASPRSMTPFSAKSARSVKSAHSVSALQKPNPSHGTFSDAIVALGFNQAASQKFEWLSSYPEARPFLSAIQTSFSPDCVLTDSQAAVYADFIRNFPQLPDDLLCEASRPFMNGAPLFPDVRRQQEAYLKSAQHRLEMLRKQREVLREAVAQKRARPKSVMSPRTPPSRRNRPGDEPSMQTLVETFRTVAQSNRIAIVADANVDAYCQREQAFFHELLTYARQNLNVRTLDELSGLAKPHKLSVKQLVNSYATIKADQCVYEARLARANAMLASIRLGKGAFFETSIASMPSLIKDLRDRGAKALKAKAKIVEEQAHDSLSNRIQTMLLTETLRQQNVMLDLLRFCAVVCLEQRIRIMCFHSATKSQELRFRALFDTFTSLASKSEARSDQEVSLSGQESETEAADGNFQKPQSALAPVDAVETQFTASDIRILENDVFDSGVQTLADLITDFINRIGNENSWLRLDSHPEYTPLLVEFENILNHNTSILDAILKRRGTPVVVSPQRQNWVTIVNSRR